jgi:hypothetical protein
LHFIDFDLPARQAMDTIPLASQQAFGILTLHARGRYQQIIEPLAFPQQPRLTMDHFTSFLTKATSGASIQVDEQHICPCTRALFEHKIDHLPGQGILLLDLCILL